MVRLCKFSFCILLYLTAGYSPATAQFLPLDSLGRSNVQEVVIADGFTGATLFYNGSIWLKGLRGEEGQLTSIKQDSLAGKISANYEFSLYAQSGILRKLSGSASYHIVVETKNNKYRYRFSDFVYHYYAQDRNYKMVKTGKTKLLEEKDAMGWQKLWTAHRTSVNNRVRQQINDLVIKMKQTQAENGTKPDAVKVDW